jgi:hypothetical protein
MTYVSVIVGEAAMLTSPRRLTHGATPPIPGPSATFCDEAQPPTHATHMIEASRRMASEYDAGAELSAVVHEIPAIVDFALRSEVEKGARVEDAPSSDVTEVQFVRDSGV